MVVMDKELEELFPFPLLPMPTRTTDLWRKIISQSRDQDDVREDLYGDGFHKDDRFGRYTWKPWVYWNPDGE